MASVVPLVNTTSLAAEALRKRATVARAAPYCSAARRARVWSVAAGLALSDS